MDVAKQIRANYLPVKLGLFRSGVFNQRMGRLKEEREKTLLEQIAKTFEEVHRDRDLVLKKYFQNEGAYFSSGTTLDSVPGTLRKVREYLREEKEKSLQLPKVEQNELIRNFMDTWMNKQKS